MIKNSFIFLDGISERRERILWSQGILSWDDFLNSKKISGISMFTKSYYDRKIILAKYNLIEQNSTYFTDKLPSTGAWRLYPSFKEKTVFLDLEAGKQKHIDIITLYDGVHTKSFIRNYNLDVCLIKSALSEFKLIVTFNGGSFDFPIFKRKFGNIIPSIPHIDVRFLCERLGLTGGLKKIERKLMLERKTTFLNRNKSLKNLIDYNSSDVKNLKPILDYCVEVLMGKYQKFFNNAPSFLNNEFQK